MRRHSAIAWDHARAQIAKVPVLPLSPDTSPAAAALQVQAWRRLGPAEKLALVRTLSTAVLRLEWEGLRLREPTLEAPACARRLAERRLGAELARRVYFVP